MDCCWYEYCQFFASPAHELLNQQTQYSSRSYKIALSSNEWRTRNLRHSQTRSRSGWGTRWGKRTGREPSRFTASWSSANNRRGRAEKSRIKKYEIGGIDRNIMIHHRFRWKARRSVNQIACRPLRVRTQMMNPPFLPSTLKSSCCEFRRNLTISPTEQLQS